MQIPSGLFGVLTAAELPLYSPSPPTHRHTLASKFLLLYGHFNPLGALQGGCQEVGAPLGLSPGSPPLPT